jgi:hypothetical protein
MPRAKKTSHHPEILRGMARGPWADTWASEQEEKGRSFSSMDLYEVAPEAPRWTEKWAKKLASSIVALNQLSLDDLYAVACEAGFQKSEETFGFYLGMQAVGHGIAWTDDISGNAPKILIPSYEFYHGAENSEPDLRFVKR